MWTCEISYPIEHLAEYNDEKIIELAKTKGISSCASGAGFGWRDIVFDEITSQDDAEKFGEYIKSSMEIPIEYQIWETIE